MGNISDKVASGVLYLAGIIASPYWGTIKLLADAIEYLCTDEAGKPTMPLPPIYAPPPNLRPEWLAPGINWAFCGARGVGKSSMINALRGLGARDPGAARVGITECTFVPTPYPHPACGDKVKLWDLPGCSPQFPRETYCQNMGLRYMNGVIVVVGCAIQEIDVSIIKELQAYTGEPFRSFWR